MTLGQLSIFDDATNLLEHPEILKAGWVIRKGSVAGDWKSVGDLILTLEGLQRDFREVLEKGNLHNDTWLAVTIYGWAGVIREWPAVCHVWKDGRFNCEPFVRGNFDLDKDGGEITLLNFYKCFGDDRTS
jgi:hypothetical protein